MTAWDAFDEANGSENDRPTNYASEQQLFVTMGMAMGGVDLEHYQVFSYEMERSSFSSALVVDAMIVEENAMHPAPA